MTLPPSIAHAIQNTQEWLKELSDNGEPSATSLRCLPTTATPEKFLTSSGSFHRN